MLGRLAASLVLSVFLLLQSLAYLTRSQGMVEITISVSPEQAGTVEIVTVGMVSSLPVTPFTFTLLEGASLTLKATAEKTFSFLYWLVNGSRQDGNPIVLVARGRKMDVKAVFGPADKLGVIESDLGEIYVTTGGQVWISLKKIDPSVKVLDQNIEVFIDVKVTQWRQVNTTDIFGITRTTEVADVTRNLVAALTCRTTCRPTHVYVYRMNGVLSTVIELNSSKTKTVIPWGERGAIVFIHIAGQLRGPYTVYGDAPVTKMPQELSFFAMMIPLGFFLLLSLRTGLRESALGLLAYSFLIIPIHTALGLPLNQARTISLLGISLALILFAIDMYGR